MWNVSQISEEANNSSEGYNNRFNKRLQKAHPNIWLFVDSIRKKVDTIHDMIRQIHSGMQPRTKRSKTRISERRIISSTIEFRHVIYYADFLVLLSKENWKIIRCDRLHLTFILLITPCSCVSKEHFSDRTISTRTIFRRSISEGRFFSREHNLGDNFTRTICLKNIGKDILQKTSETVTIALATAQDCLAPFVCRLFSPLCFHFLFYNVYKSQ